MTERCSRHVNVLRVWLALLPRAPVRVHAGSRREDGRRLVIASRRAGRSSRRDRATSRLGRTTRMHVAPDLCPWLSTSGSARMRLKARKRAIDQRQRPLRRVLARLLVHLAEKGPPSQPRAGVVHARVHRSVSDSPIAMAPAANGGTALFDRGATRKSRVVTLVSRLAAALTRERASQQQRRRTCRYRDRLGTRLVRAAGASDVAAATCSGIARTSGASRR